MGWAKTTTRRDDKHTTFGIWCDLYMKFDGIHVVLSTPRYIVLWYQLTCRSSATAYEMVYKYVIWVRFFAPFDPVGKYSRFAHTAIGGQQHCWFVSLCNVTKQNKTSNNTKPNQFRSWWRHQMESFSALLALCARSSLITSEFTSQGPVTRSFHIFFDLRLHQGWVSNRDVSDLRRHRAHYNVTLI